MPDALNTFLLVGLPSPGLDQLGIVVFIVLYPAMVISVWASFRDRTLTTLAGPIAAVAVAELLVAPVGSSRWVPVVFGLVAAAVLIVDVRNDLAVTATADRDRNRTASSVGLVEAGRPDRPGARPRRCSSSPSCRCRATFDLRQFVTPGTIRVDDANPLGRGGPIGDRPTIRAP